MDPSTPPLPSDPAQIRSAAKAYVAKRTADGLSKREIMRCLKRYVARELYPLIRDVTDAQHTNHELESAA